MTCAHARRLFGACWDDEITQGEREALEAHFASCPGCREEYEAYSRTLEQLTTLPRVEAAPDLVDRVQAAIRHAVPEADRIARPAFPWVPVTATVALLVIALALAAPWMGARNGSLALGPRAGHGRIAEPMLVHGISRTPVAAVPDSLFDHHEDVEFVLDPMTLHRGRPAVVRAPEPPRTQQATITF
jgi:anti-sigma factor RsiW